jgi:hypothetical protein
MADWGMLRGRAANVQRCHVRNRHLPARQPSGCCLLPVGRPASGAPMPGYGSRWRGEHRRTLAVRTAQGVWAAPRSGHQWDQGVGARGRWKRPFEFPVLCVRPGVDTCCCGNRGVVSLTSRMILPSLLSRYKRWREQMVRKWSGNGSVFVKTREYWRRTLQAGQGRDPG